MPSLINIHVIFFLLYSPFSLLPLYGGLYLYYKSLLILALLHPTHLLRLGLSLVADDEIGCRVDL